MSSSRKLKSKREVKIPQNYTQHGVQNFCLPLLAVEQTYTNTVNNSHLAGIWLSKNLHINTFSCFISDVLIGVHGSCHVVITQHSHYVKLVGHSGKIVSISTGSTTLFPEARLIPLLAPPFRSASVKRIIIEGSRKCRFKADLRAEWIFAWLVQGAGLRGNDWS